MQEDHKLSYMGPGETPLIAVFKILLPRYRARSANSAFRYRPWPMGWGSNFPPARQVA